MTPAYTPEGHPATYPILQGLDPVICRLGPLSIAEVRMPNTETADLLREAVNHGFSIIPVNLDKRPICAWKSYQEQLPTSDQLRNWWSAKPAGWAVVTGRLSRLVILDFDGDAGRRTL